MLKRIKCKKKTNRTLITRSVLKVGTEEHYQRQTSIFMNLFSPFLFFFLSDKSLWECSNVRQESTRKISISIAIQQNTNTFKTKKTKKTLLRIMNHFHNRGPRWVKTWRCHDHFCFCLQCDWETKRSRLKTSVITACIAAIITQLISLNTCAELTMRWERRL